MHHYLQIFVHVDLRLFNVILLVTTFHLKRLSGGCKDILDRINMTSVIYFFSHQTYSLDAHIRFVRKGNPLGAATRLGSI